MIVQIYSMTSIADAAATAEAGADLIGVVVSEPGVVPEGIDAATARAVLAAIRPQSRGIVLSLADDRDEICAMVDIVQPDVVHVAAREIEPEDCAWIRQRIAPVRLLSELKPPARITGTRERSTTVRLTDQSCVSPLAPTKGGPFAPESSIR